MQRRRFDKHAVRFWMMVGLPVIVISVFALWGLHSSIRYAAAASSDVPVCAKGQIVKVEAWAFNALNSRSTGPTGPRVDVFSVKARNPLNRECVTFSLMAYSHGQPDVSPTIITASDGGGGGAKPQLTWVLVEPKGVAKTVFFVARSVGSDRYCAGGTTLHPKKCSK